MEAAKKLAIGMAGVLLLCGLAVALLTAPATFTIQLGDLPGWLEGIGTVGALSVAVGLLVRERRSKHRAQAERVACWIGLTRGEGFELRISNTSDLPIFEVSIVLVSTTSVGAHGFYPSTIPPQTKDFTNADTNQALNGVWDAMRSHREDAKSPLESEVHLTFRDAAGQIWIRNSTGALWPVSEFGRRRFVAHATRQPEPTESG